MKCEKCNERDYQVKHPFRNGINLCLKCYYLISSKFFGKFKQLILEYVHNIDFE